MFDRYGCFNKLFVDIGIVVYDLFGGIVIVWYFFFNDKDVIIVCDSGCCVVYLRYVCYCYLGVSVCIILFD